MKTKKNATPLSDDQLETVAGGPKGKTFYYICPVCGARYSDIEDLNKHMASQHPDIC